MNDSRNGGGEVELPRFQPIRRSNVEMSTSFYPVFLDAKLYAEYKAKKRQTALEFNVFCLFLAYVAAGATRNPYSQIISGESHYFFLVANIFYYFTIILLLTYPIIYIRKKIFRQKFEMENYFVELVNYFRDFTEDTILIFATINVGFLLLGRVIAGQCKDDNIWESYKCNPVAGSNSIPLDSVILLYLLPIISQILLKNISVYGITFSWIIIIVSVVLSEFFVNGWWFDIWTVAYSFFFVYISYENERSMRLLFLHVQEISATQEIGRPSESTPLQAQSDIDIEVRRSRHEIHGVKTEASNISSLIGNIAHDLKTPLQSFRMDLETIYLILNNTSPKSDTSRYTSNGIDFSEMDIDLYPEVDLSQQQLLSSEMVSEILSIIESLKVSSSLISMVINRSLDFSKALIDIALVPNMTTFDLNEAIKQPVSYMKCLDHSIKIETHVDDRLYCSVISDKEWFEENLFCFLSNAVKYGNGREVQVFVELHETGLGAEEHVVCVTAEDRGTSLSVQDRDCVFDNINQRARNTMGGAGLGLYSLSKRIDALGGHYGVTNRRDGEVGSAFWFSFPFVPVELPYHTDPYTSPFSSVIAGGQSIGQLFELRSSIYMLDSNESIVCIPTISDSSTSNPRSTLKILLAENTNLIPKFTSITLLQHGHTVDTVPNIVTALDWLESGVGNENFNMLLVDIHTDVMGSIEHIRRYRKVEQERDSDRVREAASVIGCRQLKTQRLCIVAICSKVDFLPSTEAISSGVDHFISFPFQYKEFELLLSPKLSLSATNDLNSPTFWFRVPGTERQNGSSSPLVSSLSSGSRPSSSHSQSQTQTQTHSWDNDSRMSSPGTPVAAMHFLLVDDSFSVLKVTTRSLEKRGHTVETAPNGAVALEMLKSDLVTRQRFDILLTDIQMPVMGGIELIRTYRKLESERFLTQENQLDPDVPTRLCIISMSANSDANYKDEAILAGADYFIPKPFQYKELDSLLFLKSSAPCKRHHHSISYEHINAMSDRSSNCNSGSASPASSLLCEEV